MAGEVDVSEQVRRASAVQARYADELMKKPHVVGLAVGYVTTGGTRTSNIGLIVMVDQKVPPEQLKPDERIPDELDGVPVDVQETGVFTAQ